MAKHIVACDLDGTLAQYDGWKGIHNIGAPVPSVVQAIKNVYDSGGEVWIYTARLSDPNEAVEAGEYIEKYLARHEIPYSGITAIKHKFFTEFWDDRAVQVVRNAGSFVITQDNQHWAGGDAIVDDHSKLTEVNNAFAGLEPAFTPAEDDPLATQEGGDHYKKYAIQPIEFCFLNNIPSLESSIIKYVVRHRDKNGIEDLKKARHIIDILIKLQYGN